MVVIIKTDRLKDISREYYLKGRVKPGGDPDPKTGVGTSMNVLVPVQSLVLWTPSVIKAELI